MKVRKTARGQGGTFIKSIFPLAVLGGMKKKKKSRKIRLSSEDDIEDSQGGRGWSSQVTVISLRGTVYTFS